MKNQKIIKTLNEIVYSLTGSLSYEELNQYDIAVENINFDICLTKLLDIKSKIEDDEELTQEVDNLIKLMNSQLESDNSNIKIDYYLDKIFTSCPEYFLNKKMYFTNLDLSFKLKKDFQLNILIDLLEELKNVSISNDILNHNVTNFLSILERRKKAIEVIHKDLPLGLINLFLETEDHFPENHINLKYSSLLHDFESIQDLRKVINDSNQIITHLFKEKIETYRPDLKNDGLSLAAFLDGKSKINVIKTLYSENTVEEKIKLINKKCQTIIIDKDNILKEKQKNKEISTNFNKSLKDFRYKQIFTNKNEELKKNFTSHIKKSNKKVLEVTLSNLQNILSSIPKEAIQKTHPNSFNKIIGYYEKLRNLVSEYIEVINYSQSELLEQISQNIKLKDNFFKENKYKCLHIEVEDNDHLAKVILEYLESKPFEKTYCFIKSDSKIQEVNDIFKMGIPQFPIVEAKDFHLGKIKEGPVNIKTIKQGRVGNLKDAVKDLPIKRKRIKDKANFEIINTIKSMIKNGILSVNILVKSDKVKDEDKEILLNLKIKLKQMRASNELEPMDKDQLINFSRNIMSTKGVIDGYVNKYRRVIR